MQKANEKTILPFTNYQKNEFYNNDVEKAAVFCLSEMQRKKGGRFFKKQDTEKIAFISKVLYPFWIVPFRESTLLFEGLDTASYTINYPALPDLNPFINQLNIQPMTRQVYSNIVSNNQNYFQNSKETQSLKIEGLITDTEFISEFLDYTKQAETTYLLVTEAVLVSPAKDQTSTLKMLNNLENTYAQLYKELENLKTIIKMLNKKNLEAQNSLKQDIKATKDKFAPNIQRVKNLLESNVAKINKAYSGQCTEISKKNELQMTNLHKEIVKLEKEKEKLEKESGKIEAEIRTAAVNKDDTTEQKWKTKRKDLKEKQSEISEKMKDTQKQIQAAEERNKNILFKLKQDNDEKIKQEGKDLAELEAARDAEIKVYQNETEKLETLTSNIIQKVDELVRSREATLPEFDNLGLKQKKYGNTMVYMPFYLTSYQSKTQKRYTYLAPSNLSDGGLSTKIKCIGKTKISQIFQPRSKKIISILNSFIGLLDENIVFNHEISDACSKTSMLQKKNDAEKVKNGLTKLSEHGWLSNEELEEFNKQVTQDFPC